MLSVDFLNDITSIITHIIKKITIQEIARADHTCNRLVGEKQNL